MQPIISIVGPSDSGKTTLVEKIVKKLNQKGYRVGVLKHTHAVIKADQRGTDTDRFSRAGAKVSSICDDRLLVRFEDVMKASPRYIAGVLARDLDLLIIEGYKKEHFPKLLLSDELAAVNLTGVIGTIGKNAPSQGKVRHFKPSNINEIVRWLESDFILPGRKGRQVVVEIDGKRLPMKDFVADIISQTIRGLLGSLKGGRGRKVNISIDFGKKL